jgi:hypothetical protein
MYKKNLYKYIILIFLIFLILLILFTFINNFLNKYKEEFDNNQSGILYFCQGFTDIFNCLALINYYSTKYSKLYVIIRNNGFEIINFYIKDLKNVEIITYDDNIYCNGSICKDDEIFNNLKLVNSDIFNNSKYLFHCGADKFRSDSYKKKISEKNIKDPKNFVQNFYISYDIPYSVRVNYFIFKRNYKLENSRFNDFIKENGKKYILYHSNDNNIDFIANKRSEKYINLNKKTNIFFDYIKILENSIEFHLIDSSWAAFIYLLDAKYKLFKNKKIYLYPIRDYIIMFQEPILLDNWIFVK